MKDFKENLKEQTKNLILDKYNILLKNLFDGIKYAACIFVIIFIFKHLLNYPLKLAMRYDIKITGTDYIQLLKEYGRVVVFVILVGVLSRPTIKLANRLKSISKEGAQFANEEQDTSVVLAKRAVQNDSVEDIINSDDEKIFEEKSEENIYTRRLENSEESNNFLKCKSIKDNMKPLTALITRELYINNREKVTQEIVLERISNIKYRRKKRLEEQNKRIARNIIDFLKKNDIIESDDIEDEYYFTPFGNIFMTYFQNGII